jgi:hypothetical protein
MKRTAAQIAEQFTARREGRQVEPAAPRPGPKRPGPAKLPTATRGRIEQLSKHERMPITKEQIEALRVSARTDRDWVFARVCARALRGELDAINACKAAIHGLA